jgi:hypothetical protein
MKIHFKFNNIFERSNKKLIICIFLFPCLILSCKNFEKADSEKQGTLWQNCVYNEAEYQLWKHYDPNPLYHKILKAYMSCKGTDLFLDRDESIMAIEPVADPLQLFLFYWFKNSSFQFPPNSGHMRVLTKAVFPGTMGNYFLTGFAKYRRASSSEILESAKKIGHKLESLLYVDGYMKFEDFWDFNEAKRSKFNENNVTFARRFLSGRPFTIKSAIIPTKGEIICESVKKCQLSLEVQTQNGSWISPEIFHKNHFLEWAPKRSE